MQLGFYLFRFHCLPCNSLIILCAWRARLCQRNFVVSKMVLGKSMKGGEPNAKRHRCSSPTENRDHHPPETFTPNVPSSCTMPSTLMESDAKKTAGGNNLPGSKVIVFRRGSNTEIPKGASILPCSNNEWVAARVELNENPQLY